MKPKIIKIEEFDGRCHPNESISIAKQDVINYFADDFNLDDGKDILIDGDGKFGGYDSEKIHVFYSFKVSLTQKAVEILKIEKMID